MKKLIYFSLFLLFAGCSGNNSEEVNGNKPDISIVDFYDGTERGTLYELLEEERAAGKQPIVMFTATWCGPCKAFKKTLHHAKMKDAFEGATLVMIDVDKDSEREGYGYEYEITEVPTFLKLDTAGKVTGRITSEAWGESNPEAVAPVIRHFILN